MWNGRSTTLCGLATLVAAVLCGPAHATERQIAFEDAWNLKAGGGWIAWDGIYDEDIIVQYLQPADGDSGINGDRYLHSLGTDRDGRPTGLFTACSGAGGAGSCKLRRRDLRSWRARTILTEPNGLRITGYDEAHGRLAVGLGGGFGRGIYVRRPGGRLRRISTARLGRIARSRRVLVNAVATRGTRRIQGIDLGRHARTVTLATGSYADTRDATAAGRYVYWLEARRRIMRADMTATDPAIEFHVPKRRPTSFAVDGHRLFYARDSGGVYEVRGAYWERQPEPAGR
jgi:hypothetical protein